MADEDRSDEFSPEERGQFNRSRLILDVHLDGADSAGVAGTKDISLGEPYLSTLVDIPRVGVRFHRLSNDKRALMESHLPAFSSGPLPPIPTD